MASLETLITVFLVLYLTWAITLSNKRYHGALSLCLFFFFRLLFVVWHSGLSDLGSLLISFPLLIAVGTICFFLSPFPALFHEARTSTAQSLEILADGEPGTVCIDIVAVHGLAANSASAWDSYSTKEHPESSAVNPKESGQSSSNTSAPKHHIWLRDALPHEGLNARIMVYNHNTAWRANALNKSLSDYGDGLLHELRKVRKDHHDRPIVFMSHSFGGLIVKQAIVNAHTDQKDEAYKGIIDNTKGFVFLGVPHKGTELAKLGLLLSMFGHWKGSRTNLLEVLRPDSELNAFLHRAFMKILDQGCGTKNTVCVFESVSETFMGLPITEVVSRASAVIDGSHEIAHDQTHRSIQRSGSSDDPQYRTLVHYLSEWAKEVKDIVDAIEEVALTAMTDEQRASFRSLSFSEMHQRHHDVADEALNTCAWILEHKAYLKWQEPRSSLLWIKGKPGAGKSTIMKYIVSQNRQSVQGLQGSYFISGRGAAVQKTCSGVYRALLVQIFEKSPSLSQEFVAEYKRKCILYGNHDEKWTWHEAELRGFLTRAMLQASEKKVPTQLFVDALDEAGDAEAVALLEFFQGLARDTTGRLKVCVSSRHYPLMDIEHDLEIVVEEYNADDITTFIRNHLNGQVKDKTKAETISSEMIGRSRGVFQWVALVLPRVLRSYKRGSTLTTLLKEIQDTPQALDDLYNTLFAEAPESEKYLIVRLMRWACFSIRPLSMAELRHAMAIDFSSDIFSIHSLEQSDNFKDSDKGMRIWITDLSRGLVDCVLMSDNDSDSDSDASSDTTGTDSDASSNTTDNPLEEWLVQPNHQTVQDFVTKGGLNFLESSSIVDPVGLAHHYIYRSCLRYLAAGEILAWLSESLSQVYLHENEPLLKIEDRMFVCSLSNKAWQEHLGRVSTRGQLKSKLQAAAKFPSFPFVDYALEWVQHAQKLESLDSRDNMRDLVNLLYWDSSYITFNVWAVLAFMKRSIWDYPIPFLHLLADSGLVVATNELLKDARFSDHNLFDQQEDTALSIAAGRSNQTIVRLMLQTGKFDLETRNKGEMTPLSRAASCCVEPSGTIQALLSEGNACIDPKDKEMRTPLSHAAQHGHYKAVKLLLELNADPDSKDDRSRTPLSYAAVGGHKDVVRLLLAAKTDPDSKSDYSRTPLSYAAKGGNEGVIELLLEARADIDSKDNGSRTPLSYAAEDGHKDIVKLLLREGTVDPDSKDNESRTPLSYAAEYGHEDLVKLLLGEGTVDPDSKDNESRTPLSYAAEYGHEDVVKLLLGEGTVDPDSKDNESRTPLSYAAEDGHEDLVKLLLGEGTVDPDSKDNESRTPLSYAAQYGCEDAVKLLLETRRVSVKVRDQDGKAPLHHVLSAEDQHGPAKPVVQLLLEAGADINSQDHSGKTALHYASTLGKEEEIKSVLKVLLDTGADFKIQDCEGKTALHHALSLNYLYPNTKRIEAAVHILLEAGADINAKDHDGETALQYAVHLEREDTSKLLVGILLGAGAEIDSQDGEGRTALHHALSPRNLLEQRVEPVVRFLLEAGADIDSQDHDGETALHYALYLETDDKVESMVRVLLEAGAKVDSQDAKGKTALHYAISYTKSEAVGPTVSVLLEFGASLEIKDIRGYSPLILAARECLKQEIEILLHHGVDQDAKDPFGRTALFYIVRCGSTEHDLRHRDTTSMLETITSLIKSGLDMNHRDLYGRTALSYANEYASFYTRLEDIYQPVVDFLREQGAEDFGDIGVGMDTEDGEPFRTVNEVDEDSDKGGDKDGDKKENQEEANGENEGKDEGEHEGGKEIPFEEIGRNDDDKDIGKIGEEDNNQ